MIYLIYAVVFYLGFRLFYIEDKVAKVAIFLTSELLFSLVMLPFLPMFKGGYEFIVVCFLLSETPCVVEKIRYLNRSTVGHFVKILLLTFAYTVIVSPHLHQLDYFLETAKSLMTRNIIPLFLVFYCIRTLDDFGRLLDYIYPTIVIFFLLGVFNFFVGESFYVSLITNYKNATMALGELYSQSERFRVQGTYIYAADYGFISLFYLLLYTYGYFNGVVHGKKYIFVSAMLIFAIITCGFRTVFVCFFIAIFLFVYLAFDLGKIIKYAVIAGLLLMTAYSLIPIFQERVDQTLSIGNEKQEIVKGSSIDLRLEQLDGVMYYIEGSLLTGCGYGFFNIDMGHATKDRSDITKDGIALYGLESSIFWKLLETGLIGLSLYLYSLFYLFKLFKKSLIENRQTAALGITMVTIFTLFGIMTGEMGSARFAYPFFAIVLSLSYHHKILKPNERY